MSNLNKLMKDTSRFKRNSDWGFWMILLVIVGLLVVTVILR